MVWLLTFLLSVLSGILLWKYNSLKHKMSIREAEIEALKKRGIEFVANVSHELKTPLTSIMGYTETLRSLMQKENHSQDDRQTAKDFFDRILENTERLTRLIQDILDLSRIEQPNSHLEKKEFSVLELLSEIHHRFHHRLEKRNQFLKMPSEDKILMADRWLTEQALTNLIENAHRYCPDGSVITISTDDYEESGRRFLGIHVSDNGPGISEEDLPRIFERFYRAEKSRNRSFGGTGLGLAIVKHIMMSHEGSARVTSLRGEGSTFSLYFPAK